MELHVTGGADLVASVLEQEHAVAINDAVKTPVAMRCMRTLSLAKKAATCFGVRSLSQGQIDYPRSLPDRSALSAVERLVMTD